MRILALKSHVPKPFHSLDHVPAQIIKDYPADRPYPSCLILGRTSGGIPVHSVWAHNEANQWAVLITVYIPSFDRWIDLRRRKK